MDFYDFYTILALVIMAIGLWNLVIAILGLFPRFLSDAVGTLTDVKTKKNVRTIHGHRIPISTRYTYTYTVKGKEYRYCAGAMYSKRRLLSKVSMVYVKWFPRHAYPNRFKGTNEWVLGFAIFFTGMIGFFAIMLTK